jgi:aspartate aminotransferase-like enzyme
MPDVEDVVFLLAGPTKIHPRVLRAMAVPSMAHRGPEFKAINLELRELLQYVFQTKGDVALLSGSGTAGQEASIAGLLGPGDRVLSVTNGKFGERLYEMASLHAKASAVEFPWGKHAVVECVRAALDAGQYTALTLCHNETSTALTNPLREIVAEAKKGGLLTIVDGITSVGGLEVRLEWGIDALILGSQKCIAAPAGLAAVALSPEGSERLHDGGAFYLNLKEHVAKLKEGDTPFTPAVPLFLAMLEALRMLREEGLENRIRRTHRLAEACRAAADAVGLRLYAEREFASDTVSGWWYPPGIDDVKFRKELKEVHRVILSGAQEEIKGTVFRIGHFGIVSFGDLLAAWGAIEATLDRMGYKFERGAAVEAVAQRVGS